MKLLCVINPVAGGREKKEQIAGIERICHRYGTDITFFYTEGEHDHERLTEALRQNPPDRVIAAGGDGTIQLTASALIGTGIPMGILPMGSANGLAKDLHIPLDPLEALREILMSRFTHGLDMVSVNKTMHLIHLGDVGINAQIVEAYAQDDNRGMSTYAKYFIEKLKNSEPFDVKVQMGSASHTSEALMVVICNSRKFGSGLPVNTVSNPMDGKFEIVIVEHLDALALIKAGLSHFDEHLIDMRSSTTMEGTEAQIEFASPMLLQIDGELAGKHTHLDLKILPNAVLLITRRDNVYLNSDHAV